MTESVRWAGTVLLESKFRVDVPSPILEFFDEWKEHLPESWRKQATLDVLKVLHRYISPTPLC